MDLKSKVALVTGGAQGIGKGIATELAAAGARVVIGDIDLNAAQATADEMRSLDWDVLPLALDVSDDKSVTKSVGHGIEHFGQIDILVNNAGIHRENLNTDSTIEQFNQCFDINLFGIWRMVTALVPHFKAAHTGNIVNIASINGRSPWADTPAYSASKAAVINLTQSLAIKLGADNINVNAVCPGGVMTRMADSFSSNGEGLLENIIDERILKRPLSAQDIGCAVAFFASPRAKNITGQALNVDCGTVLS